MLQNNIGNFLQYCKNSSFSERSIESLTFRLNEFSDFTNTIPVNSISEIKFPHLVQFVTDFKQPSVHVKKARIWSLHQFFHYLKLQKLINANILS